MLALLRWTLRATLFKGEIKLKQKKKNRYKEEEKAFEGGEKGKVALWVKK